MVLGQVWWILLVILLPLSFDTRLQEPSMMPRFMAVNAIMILFTFLVGRKVLARKEMFFPKVDLVMAGYYAINLLSVFWAYNRSEALFEAQKVLPFVLVYFISRYFFLEYGAKVRTILFRASLGVTVILTLIVVSQLFGIINDPKLDIDPNTVYLVNGLSGHKNLLASYFLLLFVFTMMGWFSEKNNWKQYYMIGAGVQLAVIALLMTRTVYMALGAGIVFFALYEALKGSKKLVIPKTVYYIFGGASVLLVLVLAQQGSLGELFGRLNPANYGSSGSGLERSLLWSKTFAIIGDNWLLGVGNGNWDLFMPAEGLDGLYRAERLDTNFSRPHNDFLGIWSEIGIFGLLAFVWILVRHFFYGWKALKNQEGTDRSLLLIAMSGLLAYVVISIFDFPRERVEHQVMLAIILAIIASQSGLFDQDSKKKKSQQAGFLPLIPVLALLGFSLWFGAQRYSGEMAAKEMLGFKDQKNYPAMKAAAQKAQSDYLNLEANGIPIAWYEGVADFNMNDPQSALANFTKALEAHPNYHHVYHNIAVVYHNQQQYDLAKENYNQALSINGKFTDCRYNFTKLLVKTKEFDEAYKVLEPIPDSIPAKHDFIKLIQENEGS